MAKPHLLLCNDDGILAPGLFHLWKALRDFGKITVVAPTTEKSGVGVSMSLWHPLQIEKVSWHEGSEAWSVNGTPADCIKLACSVILDHKPDMVISGINRGSNAGRNVLSSGTVGATIDATMRGIPGIAFSSINFESPNFPLAEAYVRKITEHVWENPLPQGTLLNVNIPSEGSVQGVRLARQGKGYWVESPFERQHPDGKKYYWLGGIDKHYEEATDSDIFLLSQGYVTAVPIHIDNLTDHSTFTERQKQFSKLFHE